MTRTIQLTKKLNSYLSIQNLFFITFIAFLLQFIGTNALELNVSFWFVALFYLIVNRSITQKLHSISWIFIHLSVVFCIGLCQVFLTNDLFNFLVVAYHLFYLLAIVWLIRQNPFWVSQNKKSTFILMLTFIIGGICCMKFFYEILNHLQVDFSVDFYFFFNFLATAGLIFSVMSYYNFTGLQHINDTTTCDISSVNKDTFANELSVYSQYKNTKSQQIPYSIKCQTILEFLENTTLYLDSHFSLDELAIQTNLSRIEVSEVINTELNMNFYQLIAKYRIDHAKMLLISNKSVTVDGVMIQSGFNSKSTFNKYFKQFVGVTPSFYRQQFV